MRRGRNTPRHVISQQTVWLREEATRWYREGRRRALKALAKRTVDLRWSPALLNALLEDLHTDDAFNEIVRDPRTCAGRRYPQVLFLALAVRHSWRPDDLSRLVRRLDIRASHRHLTSQTRSDAHTSDVRPLARPHPGHHVANFPARRRSVKALRSAPTPTSGAHGLDGAVGLARKRPLRDAPGFQPPTTRSTRNRKGKNHA